MRRTESQRGPNEVVECLESSLAVYVESESLGGKGSV